MKLGYIFVITDGTNFTAYSTDEIGDPVALKVSGIVDCITRLRALQRRIRKLNQEATKP